MACTLAPAFRTGMGMGMAHRALAATSPGPYPLATQAKVEPSSIRSTANFVKAVDSVPRGVLQRASRVGRAVLAAPQPGLAPLGQPWRAQEFPALESSLLRRLYNGG